MKRLLLILVTALISVPSLFGREQTILARITVYWPSGGGSEVASWNGAKLHDGHCAVDPKKIPYGSQVVFPDATCLAIDSGPAVVSRTAALKCGKTALQRAALVIDRYFETKKQALSWAAAHPHFMEVRILDPHHRVATSEAASQTPEGSVGKTTEPETPAKALSNQDPCSPALSAGDFRGSLLPPFFGTVIPRS
jgi:hypothetical protein